MDEDMEPSSSPNSSDDPILLDLHTKTHWFTKLSTIGDEVETGDDFHHLALMIHSWKWPEGRGIANREGANRKENGIATMYWCISFLDYSKGTKFYPSFGKAQQG